MRRIAIFFLTVVMSLGLQARHYFDSIIFGSFQNIRKVATEHITMFEFNDNGIITTFSGLAVTDIERGHMLIPTKITLSNGNVYEITYDKYSRPTRIAMKSSMTSLGTDYTYTGNNYYPSTSSSLVTAALIAVKVNYNYSAYKFNSRGDYIGRTATDGKKSSIQNLTITYWDELPAFNEWEWEVTPGKYSYIRNFSEGLAQVSLGKFYGYIDKNGNLAIPALTDFSLSTGDFHCGLAYVANEKHVGYIDKSGKLVIPAQYNKGNNPTLYGKDFSDGFAVVDTDAGSNYIDRNNRRLLGSDSHGYLSSFEDGIAKTGKGFVNTDGTYIYRFEPGYSGSYYCSKGLLFVTKKDGSSGAKSALMDKTGKFLTGYDYQDLKLIDNPKYAMVLNNGKWGAIDLNGNVVIPYEYDNVVSYREGYAVLQKGENEYIVNSEMQICPTPFAKKSLTMLGANLVRFKDPSTGLYGVLDSSGKTLHQAELQSISDESEGYIGFVKDKKAGYMNTRGEIVISPVYDPIFGRSVGQFKDGMAVACIGEHFGVISTRKHAGSPKTTSRTTTSKGRSTAARRTQVRK